MRKGSANVILIIGSILIGLAGMGFMLSVPTVMVGNVEHQVAETGTPTRAKLFADYIRTHYEDDAMNWSPYHTAFVFGRNPRPPIKNWEERDIPERDEIVAAFENRGEEDFHQNYIGDETIEEGCKIQEARFDLTVLEPYAQLDNKEGMNYSMEAASPFPVRCTAETGESRVMMAPLLHNVTHRSRFFHFYNLSQNLTQYPRFRFLVEGAAMNVSNMLQIETNWGSGDDPNCILGDSGFRSASDTVAHGAGYGWTGNADGSAPYNDGPDCTSDEKKFQPGTDAFKAILDQAENKYEARIAPEVESSLAPIETRYENPDAWDPAGKNHWYSDVNVEITVEELEYRIEVVDKQYLDRKVIACKQSHGNPSDPYYVASASASRSDTGDSCSCDYANYPSACASGCGGTEETRTCDSFNPDGTCSSYSCEDAGSCPSCTKGSCDENCGSCSDSIETVTGTCSNGGSDICGTTSQVKGDLQFTCGCSGDSTSASGCTTNNLDYLTWTNPPASVDDGQVEESGPIGISRDCPGKKYYGESAQTSCELDNQCRIDSEGYKPDGTATSGDEQSLSDETGTFRSCDGDPLYSGSDNVWYIKTDASHPDPGGSPAVDWGSSDFPDRLFTNDYTTSDVAARISPSTVPLRERIRAQSCFDCPSSSSCTVDDSCTYDYTSECTITRTENTYYDQATQDEVVQTTGEYRFNLKAYVKLKITVTDRKEPYRIPTKDGLQRLKFVSHYEQFTISTFERSSPDTISACNPSSPKDPDSFDRSAP